MFLWADDGSAPRKGGPPNTENGGLFLIDMANEPVVPQKVLIHDWPSRVAFHPHGFDILFFEELTVIKKYTDIVDRYEPAQTLIYIINHAYGKQGERIEILEYKDGEFYY
jgi:hypothetical protein